MNSFIFRTGGDWDTTTLHNNGQEVMAAQLFIELHAGKDYDGEPTHGGVERGGEIDATLRLQDAPDNPIGMFPGRVEMQFPEHSLIVENTHPAFDFEFTRVWYNGHEVTRNILDVYVDINSVDNIVQAYLTIFKPHWFSTDEVATYTIV